MSAKTKKTPACSAVETTHLVLPSDTNALGSAFGGKIMQWMDIAAAVCAGRHCAMPVVTVAVDDLYFARKVRLGEVVTVLAQVNYTGRSSMEVGVRVEHERLTDPAPAEHCLSGYFTFVALGPTGEPAEIPAVELESDVDRRRHEAAVQRRERRLQGRASKLSQKT